MVLTLEQVRAITLGVDRVTEESGDMVFHRFTEEQELFYKKRSESSYLRMFGSAGIVLSFTTDSRTLSLDILTVAGSSRSYFSVDVFVDGKKRGSLNNFEGVELPEKYTTVTLPLGEYRQEFELGDGEKQVRVYLPWAVKTCIRSIQLDDGATIRPVKPKHTLLAFGDSITQGYDAKYPSNMYITRFAEFLDAELFNKAIGGEVFAPSLALMKEQFVPDYITVAYGTNDWSLCTREEFVENCTGFFKNLRTIYPTSKIVAITPIFRHDSVEGRAFGDFTDVDATIRECVCDGITVISGYDFVSKSKSLYADFSLHPNDDGFAQYYEGLIKAWNV